MSATVEPASSGTPPEDAAAPRDEPASEGASAGDGGPDEPRRDEPASGTADPTEDRAEDRTEDEPRRRRARRVVVRTFLVALVVVVALGCWLAVRAWQAGTALLDARTIVTQLQADTGEGSTERIRAELPAARAALDKAHRATADPIWGLAGHLPWVGDDLRAVRTVSAALDDLTRTAIPAVDQIGTVLDAQRAPGTDGRLDLEPLAAAAPDIRAAAASAAAADAALAAIDTGRLLHPLAGPVGQVQDAVHQISGQLDTGAQVATLLPAMLGADGPRTYLLVTLNSSELRSPGGIAGAFVVLHADDGAIELTEQRSTADFPPLAVPVLPLTAEERHLQTDRLGQWVQDAVFTPDFPRAAQLLVARWEQAGGGTVDGVVATDPVAARYLLGAIGPVAVPDGPTLTADNLLPTLLHDAYLRYPDPAVNDRFYASVSAAIFRAAGAGQGGDERGVVEALARAGAEGRLRMWSAHADEQRRIVGTSVGAAFLSGSYGSDAGVFLDDATAGKLDYYLTTTYTITDLRCTGPHPSATVRLALAYDPPADVTTYPLYVTGTENDVIPVGDLATRISVYAPVGAQLEALRLDDGYVSGITGTAHGRQVQTVSSLLKPGEKATYGFTVPLHDGRVDVWTTPTLTSSGHLHASCG